MQDCPAGKCDTIGEGDLWEYGIDIPPRPPERRQLRQLAEKSRIDPFIGHVGGKIGIDAMDYLNLRGPRR